MNWYDDMQIWIPAQGGSTRVKDKNTKPFYKGESLLEIKINQLLKLIDASHIHVSSESETALSQAGNLGCHTINREKALVGNEIKQSDLFDHFFKNTKASKYVLWCQVTDPLFSDFNHFFDKPLEEGRTRVLASELKKHAFLNNAPLNFQFGLWHKTTQNIEPLIVPRWSCFLHHYEPLKETAYHFGVDNEFYITDDFMVDIDTENDFTLARLLFEQKSKND